MESFLQTAPFENITNTVSKIESVKWTEFIENLEVLADHIISLQTKAELKNSFASIRETLEKAEKSFALIKNILANFEKY